MVLVSTKKNFFINTRTYPLNSISFKKLIEFEKKTKINIAIFIISYVSCRKLFGSILYGFSSLDSVLLTPGQTE